MCWCFGNIKTTCREEIEKNKKIKIREIDTNKQNIYTNRFNCVNTETAQYFELIFRSMILKK